MAIRTLYPPVANETIAILIVDNAPQVGRESAGSQGSHKKLMKNAWIVLLTKADRQEESVSLAQL